jgi:chromate reductase
MKHILAIGSSNSKASINKVLAEHIASKIENTTVNLLDWETLELPLFGVDLETKEGIPTSVTAFKEQINKADALVISLAEHNGLPTAAFKNLWDWTSRIDAKFWGNKPMFLAATSPGKRGGMGALAVIKQIMPHFGGNVITDFSLPSFYDNFKAGKITDSTLELSLGEKIALFQKSI